MTEAETRLSMNGGTKVPAWDLQSLWSGKTWASADRQIPDFGDHDSVQPGLILIGSGRAGLTDLCFSGTAPGHRHSGLIVRLWGIGCAQLVSVKTSMDIYSTCCRVCLMLDDFRHNWIKQVVCFDYSVILNLDSGH